MIHIPTDALYVSIIVVLIALSVGWFWASRRTSRASSRRNQQAAIGEAAAEKLLKKAGYRIIERQVLGRWWMWVDGEEIAVEVRADLLVQRRRRTYIAEVKTGRLAPDPLFPATRRQLLEYRMVFDTDGVLLVDAEGGEIHRIDFPVQRTDC